MLVPFLTAFGLSLALVPAARALARRVGAMAHPKQDRWHRHPTALFGGVAITVTVFVCALAFEGVRSQPVLLGCGLLIFMVGLTDDVISLKPSTKLVAQLALASAFLFFGYRLGWVHSLVLDSVLTVLWIVGITNAFNLLDNMDGLCAGIAVIAAAAYVINLSPAAPGTFEYATARYAAMLCGATAGFLVYNVQPASIFMGDSGSLFIGLTLAALALVPRTFVPGPMFGVLEPANGPSPRLLPIIAAPVAVLLVPILDTTLVTFSRMFSGRSAAKGGRDHSSHRLVAIGLSERAAVAVLWGLAVLAGAVGVTIRHASQSWSALLGVIFLIGLMIFASFLARVRVYEEPDLSRVNQGRMTPVVAELFYRRRAAEVMLDFMLVLIAYYGAYRLRFNDRDFVANFYAFLNSLPIVLAVQMIALFVVGAYRGLWKHFGLHDAVTFGKATLLGAFGAQIVVFYATDFDVFQKYKFVGYSRAAFVIYPILLFGMLTLSRASFRLISDFAHRRRQVGQRLVIYGAGDGGALAVRELLSHPTVVYRVLGFVDDDPLKRRMRLHGYPVLGGSDHLAALIRDREVDAVVISAQQFDLFRQRELATLCREHGVALSRLRVDLEPLVADVAS